MIHIIYNSIYILIIIFLFWWLVRAYDFANRKHKELIRTKDSMRIPYELISHYDSAYVEFYKWMTENDVKIKVIRTYEVIFKQLIKTGIAARMAGEKMRNELINAMKEPKETNNRGINFKR